MKKLLLSIICLSVTGFVSGQCNIPYVTKTFKKIEYYTAENGKLKLVKTTNSTNTFEILKNTSNTMGDMLALNGNMGKYVEFIREYECEYDPRYTNYKFHVGTGTTNDFWIVTFLKDETLWKVSNIRAKQDVVIVFVN